MANWRQVTTVNGEQKYETRILTADEMVDRLGQILFMIQSGNNYTIERELNDMDERVKYIFTKQIDGKEVVNTFTKI